MLGTYFLIHWKNQMYDSKWKRTKENTVSTLMEISYVHRKSSVRIFRTGSWVPCLIYNVGQFLSKQFNISDSGFAKQVICFFSNIIKLVN